jgi:hypothetical protein
MKKPNIKRDDFTWLEDGRNGECHILEASDKLQAAHAALKTARANERKAFDDFAVTVETGRKAERVRALQEYQLVKEKLEAAHTHVRAAQSDLDCMFRHNDNVSGWQMRGRVESVKVDGKHKPKSTNQQGQTVDVCKDEYIRQRQAKSLNTHNAAAGAVARKHGFTTAQVKRAAERGKWVDG